MFNLSTNTKKLVFSAMALALALATSYIRVIKMPMGGSVTLFSMLFICLIGYWFGPKFGITAGVAFGFLQLIIDPQFFSIAQIIIDYPLAHGALGLSGFFSKKKHGLQVGYLVGVFGRFLFGVLSGFIFFGIYAPAGMHPLIYSIIYNGAYLGLEGAITFILLSLAPVANALTNVKVLATQN